MANRLVLTQRDKYACGSSKAIGTLSEPATTTPFLICTLPRAVQQSVVAQGEKSCSSEPEAYNTPLPNSSSRSAFFLLLSINNLPKTAATSVHAPKSQPTHHRWRQCFTGKRKTKHKRFFCTFWRLNCSSYMAGLARQRATQPRGNQAPWQKKNHVLPRLSMPRAPL